MSNRKIVSRPPHAYAAAVTLALALLLAPARTHAQGGGAQAAEQPPKVFCDPFQARALLGVAHLYADFDVTRAAQVLRAAVKVVNALTDPDFGSDTVGRQIGNDSFTVYAAHRLPGIRLENVFRDFGAALSAAGELSDKYVRATAVLALASKCLEESEKQNRAAPPPSKQKRPAREP